MRPDRAHETEDEMYEGRITNDVTPEACPYQPCPRAFDEVGQLLTHVARAHQAEVLAETREMLREERARTHARQVRAAHLAEAGR